MFDKDVEKPEAVSRADAKEGNLLVERHISMVLGDILRPAVDSAQRCTEYVLDVIPPCDDEAKTTAAEQEVFEARTLFELVLLAIQTGGAGKAVKALGKLEPLLNARKAAMQSRLDSDPDYLAELMDAMELGQEAVTYVAAREFSKELQHEAAKAEGGVN